MTGDGVCDSAIGLSYSGLRFYRQQPVFFVLFGLIDPLDMVGAWAEEFNIGVRLAYGLAFAFLYLLCLLAASLTMFMIRTGPSRGHAKGEGRRPIPEVHDPSESNPDLDGEDWK